MKRILSIMMVVAMLLALCMSAMAAVDVTGEGRNFDDDFCGFKPMQGKVNVPVINVYTTDAQTGACTNGDVHFVSPEATVAGDCFIRKDCSFADAYGKQFCMNFEFCLNALETPTTSTNNIFMMQIKDGNRSWGANYKFFTITEDGQGGYYLWDANNSACTKTALKTDTFYVFSIFFDLEADIATVLGCEYGATPVALYTTKLKASGDITTMMIGQGDEKTGWVYDYTMDTLHIFSTGTDFADGADGAGYAASIFATKDGAKNAVATEVTDFNHYLHFFNDDATRTASDAMFFIQNGLKAQFGDVVTIDFDYKVNTNGVADKFGIEWKNPEGNWVVKNLDAALTHATIVIDFTNKNMTINGTQAATWGEGERDESFKIGFNNEKSNHTFDVTLDNLVISGELLTVSEDFEGFHAGDLVGKESSSDLLATKEWQNDYKDKDPHEDTDLKSCARVDGIDPDNKYVHFYADGTVADKTDASLWIGGKAGAGMRATFGEKFTIELDYEVITQNEADKFGFETKDLAGNWYTGSLDASAGVHHLEFKVDGQAGTMEVYVDGAKLGNGRTTAVTVDYGCFRVGSCNTRNNAKLEYKVDNIVITSGDASYNADLESLGMYEDGELDLTYGENEAKVIYLKPDFGTIYLDGEMDNANKYLALVDTVEDENGTDGFIYICNGKNMTPVFGKSWQLDFKYNAPNPGVAKKACIEWKNPAGSWVQAALPATEDWTDASFIVDGVNNKWTLVVGGEIVKSGTFDKGNVNSTVKIGVTDTAANTFEVYVDDIKVNPIICEVEEVETTTTAKTTDADDTHNTETSDVNSAAAFIALVSVIAIGTGIIVSKRH